MCPLRRYKWHTVYSECQLAKTGYCVNWRNVVKKRDFQKLTTDCGFGVGKRELFPAPFHRVLAPWPGEAPRLNPTRLASRVRTPPPPLFGARENLQMPT